MSAPTDTDRSGSGDQRERARSRKRARGGSTQQDQDGPKRDSGGSESSGDSSKDDAAGDARKNSGGSSKSGGGKRKRRNKRRRGRRRGNRRNSQKGVGFWGEADKLPEPDTTVRISDDPAAVPRSLGHPPLPGNERIAQNYFELVYTRAAMMAGAVAAAGGLIEPDDLAEEHEGA